MLECNSPAEVIEPKTLLYNTWLYTMCSRSPLAGDHAAIPHENRMKHCTCRYKLTTVQYGSVAVQVNIPLESEMVVSERAAAQTATAELAAAQKEIEELQKEKQVRYCSSLYHQRFKRSLSLPNRHWRRQLLN
jgi:hypothetical protein